ncbi:hypothetical protein GUJ93_ZPchr0010g11286 [Zizania palustris]|uniref:Translocase of chloroplast 159/132 membrane anchor domain-containing protein n=1 Tax=Zizania palustris TaxID=103762 RepID=A0A8J5W7T0_ZIZPA|nr:hypothetical protein GUJ93_ZPchr0010g11286 [Zizania palustris]
MATIDAPVAPFVEEKPAAPDGDKDAAEAKEEDEEEEEEEDDEQQQPKIFEPAVAEEEDEEVRLEWKGETFGGEEAKSGGEDSGEVELQVWDGTVGSLEAAEAKDEGGDGEFMEEDWKAASLSAVEARSDELGRGVASPASSDAPAVEEKGELGEEPKENALAPEVNGAAATTDLAEEEKPADNKGEEVAAGGGDDGELGNLKEVTVSADTMETALPEDKVALEGEANGDLGDNVEEESAVMAVAERDVPEESSVDTNVEDKEAKPDPVSISSPEDKVAPEAEANGDLGDKMEEESAVMAVAERDVPEESSADTNVEDKEAKPEPVSDLSLEDKVAPEAEPNGDLSEKAEEVSTLMAVAEQDAPEESSVKETNVEDKETKPEPVSNSSSEDRVAPEAEANVDLGDKAEEVSTAMAVAEKDAPEESSVKDTNVEDEAKPEPVEEVSAAMAVAEQDALVESSGKETNVEDKEAKPEPVSNSSPVVIDDDSSEKSAPVSADSAVEETIMKGQTVESQGSESVEIVSVEKPTEIESDVAGGNDVVLSRELAPEQIKENNVGLVDEGPAEVVDHEEGANDDEIVLAAADEEYGANGADDDEDGGSSDRSPARVAIIESSEAVKQIMKEIGEGSSSGSPVSGLSSSREYTNSMDGQIVLDDSEEDDDDDEDDEKGFDSAALAALLKAATGASPDGNITVSSQDGSRIFSMDRPAGLGSSAPSLRPTAPRPPARSNLFGSSELAVTAEPTEEMTEEEKKLHDKVELIRVKFLRLVYRLGATPEETVAAQVLYRLSLAEGIRHGRQTNRAFSLDNARKKALLLETEGKEELNFSCNILVLGKTGVGKSLRPNVMDQGANRKILASVKKYTKRCPPDIVLYVDRLDSLSRDLNDLPLLKTITSVLDSSIWFNAIVALTHAASAPPEGLNGAPMTYEVLMAQRSHIIQQSIRQAAGDMRLMNPVALVENHPSCRRNRDGQKVLPNGQSWRHQMLLLCYSSKILSEANSLLKLQDPSPGKLFGLRFRSPPLPFLLSSLLQSRAHPKLSSDQGGNEGDSDIDLDDYSDIEQDEDEEEYDQLPPFKPLTKSQLARLTKEQKNAYFDEYDYRVKLLQKKQWKDEIRRLKEMKRGKTDMDPFGYASIAGEDQDPPPENVSVPLPDMVLPSSFDCDNPTYRYRFLEATSTVLARPVLDAHGWDHDCGYDGVSVEETLAILSKFPANVAVQVTKDKKEFSIHLDSSIAAKHGDDASSLAGFDIQTVGRQLAYILRGETKFKNIKKNKTTGGFSVTFLGDVVATGVKVEDQLSVGKRLALVASTGAMRAQGDTAYGANLEARLKDKDFPIGQSLSTLGLSLMKWRRDLALGANLQSQFSIGRGSKMALRLGLNNKLSGQITVRTSTSEQVQIALLGLVPVAASIYRSLRPSEPSFTY